MIGLLPSFRFQAAFLAPAVQRASAFLFILQILKAVSSRLQCPLRSSRKRDNFRLERIRVCNGLTMADALAQDQYMHHERTSVHHGDCPTFR